MTICEMATMRAWQGGAGFRKLLCHEVVNRGSVAAPCHGQQSVDGDCRAYSWLTIDQEELGTCGSLTGPHAPPARGPILTSCSSRERPRTGPSSSAGVARCVPSALRTRSTTASSLVSGAE